jgi:ParB-like chromosome segregation protein Spo0J
MNMNSKIVKISTVKVNPNNPRLIKDEKFKKLVASIKDFPEMLNVRPIVVNQEMIILGGNMRYKACIEAGLKEVPIIIADFNETQQKEFLIKDNVSGGEWDWDVLANEWNAENLEQWGLNVWQLKEDYYDTEEVEQDKAPRASSDGHSIFELVMEHDNKLALVDLLNTIKNDKKYDKIEQALMELVESYKTNKKK